MTGDEVRDMIGKALDGEPPVGLDYETVLGAGRRRRARRHLGIVAGAVLGVVAVAGAAVTVNRLSASPVVGTPASPPSTPTTTAPTSAGCAAETKPDARSGGVISPDLLAESGRLTDAFGMFTFPALPAGVTMEPAMPPRLCVLVDSWGAEVTLRGPGGMRSFHIEVLRRAGQPGGECATAHPQVACRTRTLDDGTVIRFTETRPPKPTQPTLVNVAAWRPDGTIVRLLETGAEAPKAAPRILSDDNLMKIAIAPELKVNWAGTVPTRPAEPSSRRAAELTAALAQNNVLPKGMHAVAVPEAIADPMAFYVSQGGYKLNADLKDDKGKGNLFINLSPPPADGRILPVSCDARSACERVDLPDGRSATLIRQTDGEIVRHTLSMMTHSGAELMIMTANQSAEAGRKSTPTRPEPPLAGPDLIDIATVPGLDW